MRYLLLALLLLPMAHAKVFEMHLLAVSDNDIGSVAELSLEVKPGNGRIFIDTFPLTRVDTQISTRFARSVACDHLNIDCSNRDFFYTIRSNSIIVGGPSAGGALTALTIIALENENYDNSVAVTGTINSGGIIGPVGGLEPKIRAASEAGLSKVLIPSGERIVEANNISTDLYSIGEEVGIKIYEVATIDDVLFHFTGKKKDIPNRNLSAESIYTTTMKSISDSLCGRSEQLLRRTNDANSTQYAVNLTNRADAAKENNEFYSAASFCFGANIRLSQQILIEENVSIDQLKLRIHREQKKLLEFKEKLNNMELRTITDLQVFEIVMERLIESEENYLDSVEYLEADDLNSAINVFGYAVERYNSASSWSSYFGIKGKNLALDKASVRKSCIQKLSEAEERFQYVLLYTSANIGDTRDNIQKAEEHLTNEEYELCLFRASKAKAEADIVLSALSISQSNIDNYLQSKLELVENIILAQQDQGNFPILGYSYYEYANTLRESDPYSAILYAEYALELSNLQMYFNANRKKAQFQYDSRILIAFLLGLVIGAALLNIYYRRKVCD